MPLLTFDTFNFLEIQDKFFAVERGLIPLSLADFSEESQEMLNPIFSQLHPQFFKNNILAAEVDNNQCMRILGFSIALQDNQLALIFGALSETPNVVPISFNNGKLMAGAAKINIASTDPNKEDAFPQFYLALETEQAGVATKWRIPAYGHVKEGTTFDQLDDSTSLEQLSSYFKPFGGVGCKLVDFVRPYIGQAQATRGRLPKPIILQVGSWDVQEAPAANPEFGESIFFSLIDPPSAQRPDGTIVEKPQGVYINAKRPGLGVAAQLMTNPKYAERAVLALQAGGRVEIWITEINNSDPDRKMPKHQIRIVPAEGATAAITPAGNVVTLPKTPQTVEVAATPVATTTKKAAVFTTADDDEAPVSFGAFA